MISWEHIELLIKGTNKRFEMVEENAKGTSIKLPVMIRTGDLLLRKINAIFSPVSPYHVGIYCGKFVIEFTGNHFTLLTLSTILLLCHEDKNVYKYVHLIFCV